MMLDWRGLAGTLLVHGAAVAGWPALGVWPTTLCLCWTPSYDVVEIKDFPQVRQMRVFTYVDPPIGIVTAPYTVRKACGSTPDRAPMLLSYPDIPAHLRDAGSVAFCATVQRNGRVSGLTLLRSGDRPQRDVAEVRRLLRQARFMPGMQPTRIEIALTS